LVQILACEAAQMNRTAFARRWIGGAILGISLPIGLWLYLSGAPLMSFRELESDISPGGNYLVEELQIHRPLGALLVIGLTGFLLLIIPPRKNRPPKIHPESKE
jgi:hypothetical protein